LDRLGKIQRNDLGCVARRFRDPSQVVTHFHNLFPGLIASKWSIKSPYDDTYQCIAWAACHTNVKWWPGYGTPQPYWPPEANFNDSVDAFVQAFATKGYKPCTDRAFEFGYQKVAIYATNDRKALHMARQHFFGKGWLSKCGNLEDILHADLESIEGDPSPVIAALGRSYGKVDTILKRTWWSAVVHRCVFRSTWAAIKFYYYRVSR
jgi:hypothetical protein